MGCLQTVRKSESQFAQNKDKIVASFAPQHEVGPLRQTRAELRWQSCERSNLTGQHWSY